MNNNNQDFVRHLPDSTFHFGRGLGIWQKLHIDPILLSLLLALTSYGLIVLYSASGQNEAMLKRQILFFFIAYIAMFFVSQVKISFLKRIAPWIYLLGLAILILVFFIGVDVNGAKRWISLGFIRFQPSEVLKLAVPIMISSYLSERMLPPKFKHISVCLVVIFLPTILILKQPDLGTSILISTSGLLVLFLAGIGWRYIFGSIGLVVASLWPMWHFVLRDYQKQRILTLFNPEEDKLGSGWNIIQSKTAIGSGGTEGKGWMQGTQSQLEFLPESHTDFIIAVLAEEFGLFGVVLLIGLYSLIVARGLYVAWQAQNNFSRLLAGGVTLTFFVYVVVNIGMVSGVLPVVGVPLPMVSLGGTSIVTLMSGFGILMAISTEKKRTTT